VPQTPALLLVPSKVAGGAEGKAPNSAGTKMRPPPPTTASTKPANIDAKVTKIHSMGRDCRIAAWGAAPYQGR